MRPVGLLPLLATVAAASWLGDEYWTLIGPRGEPIQGNAASFAQVAQHFKSDETNRFVAYWMTNTHYEGRMYEQFGEAYKKEGEDGEVKYCARFSGLRGEAVQTCENFRILTVPDRYRGREVFEWVKITSLEAAGEDKIGYNDHLVCAFAYDPVETSGRVKYDGFTFGDAVPSKNAAIAVSRLWETGQPESQRFDNYLLRLLVDESTAQQNIPRLPSPPSHEQHHAHRQHVERRPNVDHQQQETNQDAEYQRRLAEYNEKIRQQQHQSQGQEQQAQQDAEYQRRLAEYNEKVRQQQLQQQQPIAPVQVQPIVSHPTDNLRFICDTYRRVFEMKMDEDGRTRYHNYDVAAHGGVRPPCTLIGETPGQSVRQEGGVEQPVLQQQQRQPEQRPYPVRRSCTGSRQKKDAEDDFYTPETRQILVKESDETIAIAFPDYKGPHEFDESVEFIKAEELLKKQTGGTTKKQVYFHLTCATDTNQVKLILQSVISTIVRANLCKTGLY